MSFVVAKYAVLSFRGSSPARSRVATPAVPLALSSLAQLSDEELVRLAQGGDRHAIEYLLGKFKQLVLQQVRPYYLTGADNEDLVQEGMIGLYKAIRDFSFEKARPFSSFAVLCVRRQILTAIKLANRMKCMPLNQAYSLDQPPSDDATISLGEALASTTERAPEEVWIDKITTKHLRLQIKRRLSPLEYESISLYAVGLNYHEIAMRLGRSSRSIDRALFRGKRKVKVLLTSDRKP